MKMKLPCFIVFIALGSSPAAATIYTLDDTVGSLTITGTITTDGFIGVFPSSSCCLPPDILGWNLVISNGTVFQALVGPSASSFIGGLSGDSLTATSYSLICDY